MFVAELAQRTQEFRRHHPHAALALHGFDDNSGGLGPDGLLYGFQVVSGDLDKARHAGPEAFQIFFIAAGIDGGIGAAMKGALEADDMKALGMTADILVAPRHLDGEFDGFGAGIGEKARVGKGVGDQLFGQAFLPGHPVKVGGVPQLARLLGERLHHPGIGVTEGVDGNAGTEIQVSLAILGEKVGTLATDEGDIRPVIGGKQCREHGQISSFEGGGPALT